MSWLCLLAGLAWGQEASEEETGKQDEAESSELDELEEQIRVTEAKLKLAELEKQLAEVEGDAKGSTDAPAGKPPPPQGQKPDKAQQRPPSQPKGEDPGPGAKKQPRPDKPEKPPKPQPPKPKPTPEDQRRDVKDPPPKLGPEGADRRPPQGPQDKQRPQRLKFSGDMRGDLLADRLDNMHPDVPEDPTVEFGVTRALVAVEAFEQAPVGMVVQVDIFTDNTTTAYATGSGSVDVLNSPSGWRMRLLDAYARADLAGGELQAGNLFPIFGSGTFSRREDTWYMSGHLFREPFHQEGLIPYRTLGVGYGRDLGSMLRLDAQLTNTAWPETRIGKDLTLRLGVQPNDKLRASGSVMVGPGAGGATKVGYAGVVQGSLANTHLLLEVVGQQGLQAPVLGASAHLVQDIPVAASDSLDRISLAGRVHWYDPNTDLVADHHTTLAAGTNFWIQPLPKLWLVPNAGWEMVIPDDLDLAIEHRVMAQLRLRF